jgi:heme o synthase
VSERIGAIGQSIETTGFSLSAKLRDYALLTKVRLSLLGVFSSAIAYAMASSGHIDWVSIVVICLGGFLTTGASNALNQVIEKDFDLLMNRTMNRPLPQERMSVIEALLVAGVMGVAGIGLLWIYFNQLAALFAALALLSYAFIYTPMKRYSPLAVVVGAVPGALPPLIGWVAATGSLSMEALAMFAIQFVWQFPHFWAIAWVSHDDYTKAGYKLLPSAEGRTKSSALQTLIVTALILPVGLWPLYLGVTGWMSAAVVTAAGLFFFLQSVELYRSCSVAAARRLMFGSFFYLPVVQLALYFDHLTL